MDTNEHHQFMQGDDFDQSALYHQADFDLPSLENEIIIGTPNELRPDFDHPTVPHCSGQPNFAPQRSVATERHLQPCTNSTRVSYTEHPKFKSSHQFRQKSSALAQAGARQDTVGGLLSDIREIRSLGSPLSALSRRIARMEQRLDGLRDCITSSLQEQNEQIQRKLESTDNLGVTVGQLHESVNVMKNQYTTVLNMAQESVDMIKAIYNVDGGDVDS